MHVSARYPINRKVILKFSFSPSLFSRLPSRWGECQQLEIPREFPLPFPSTTVSGRTPTNSALFPSSFIWDRVIEVTLLFFRFPCREKERRNCPCVLLNFYQVSPKRQTERERERKRERESFVVGRIRKSRIKYGTAATEFFSGFTRFVRRVTGLSNLLC